MPKRQSKPKIITGSFYNENHGLRFHNIEIKQVEPEPKKKKSGGSLVETVVAVHKNVKPQQGDVLHVGLGFRSKQALVKSVKFGGEENLVTVVMCNGSAEILRVGWYRNYWLGDKAEDLIGTVLVDHQYAARKITYEHICRDGKEMVGEAELLMPKCDVRPLDRINFEWYVPEYRGMGETTWLHKWFVYVVDAVDTLGFDNLICVTVSADNRRLPDQPGYRWDQHPKNV